MTEENKSPETKNLFEEVLVASHRAKQLALGHSPLIADNGEKRTILAMRELAEGKIDKSILEQETELNQSVEDILSQAYSQEEESTSEPTATAEPAEQATPAVDAPVASEPTEPLAPAAAKAGT